MSVTLFLSWTNSNWVDYTVTLRNALGNPLQTQEVRATGYDAVIGVQFEGLDELTDYQVELEVPHQESVSELITLTTPAAENDTVSVTFDWEGAATGDAVRVLDNRQQVLHDLGAAAPPVTLTGLARYAHGYIELTRDNGDVELFWFYTPPKKLPEITAAIAPPAGSYNPHPIPVPNPSAIPRSGISMVPGSVNPLKALGYVDQIDGSGGQPGNPNGVASDPARRGVLEGNTTDHYGNPLSRRVRCFERRSGRIVREAWSNAAGYYRFQDLDPNKRFTIVAHDYRGTYNAVVADNAKPKVPA